MPKGDNRGVPDLTGEMVRVEDFKTKLQRLSVLANEFYDLMEETKEAFDKTTTPLKSSYVTLIDEFTHRLLNRHMMDDRFYISEVVMGDLTDICQSRMSRKILQPGYIWDTQITRNICQMLDHIPSDELQTDNQFLKTVAKLPPIHPIRAGPGTWFVIHTLAKGVTTREEHLLVCDQITALMKHFYCPKCKENFRQYLTDRDPKKLVSGNSNVNKAMVVIDQKTQKRSEAIMIPKLFIWTVEFHNHVNQHKDNYTGAKTKFQMDILEAWNLYTDYRNENFTPCLSCILK